MPGLGKASKTSVYEYALSLEGDKWFPTIGVFVHPTSRMVRKLSISYPHLLFLKYSVIYGCELYECIFNPYIFKMQLKPLVKAQLFFLGNYQHSVPYPNHIFFLPYTELKPRTESRRPESESRPCILLSWAHNLVCFISFNSRIKIKTKTKTRNCTYLTAITMVKQVNICKTLRTEPEIYVLLKGKSLLLMLLLLEP